MIKNSTGGLKMMRLLKYLVVSICGMKEQRMMTEGDGDTPENDYKIKTFNVVMDNIIACLECRFSISKELYCDLELFDTRRFEEISKNGIHSEAIHKICKLLPHIDKHKLRKIRKN
ncbi:hypothetical protein QTP88_010539 [Uroleucon formosanum]